MDSRCLRDLGRRGNRCICSAQTVDLGQSMDCLAQSVDRPLSTVCARQSMDCTSSRREAQAALTHLREVRPGAAEILSRLCLFVNSENSQLAKWCGLYTLSLSPYRLWRSADRRLATKEGCFSDLNWKTSYCSELSDWPFELSRVLTITVEWVA